MEKYAGIIVDISHESVDRPFSYRIPTEMEDRIGIGSCVTVPFGKSNKEITGYVVEIKEEVDFPPEKIKPILNVVADFEDQKGKMIALAAFMKDRYGSTMIQALKTVLPVKQTYKPKEKKTIVLQCTYQEAENYYRQCVEKHRYAQERVLEALLKNRVLEYQLAIQKLHVASATVKSLEKNGIIEIISEDYFLNPITIENQNKPEHPLLPQQKEIVDAFWADYESGQYNRYLIHGITGSGKTRIYLEMIKKVVNEGKQVIFLIPEIALTYQTVVRFYRYFGNRVSILNSTMSMGEKYDQYERAKRGEIDVIIGPRSALFVPFPNLGLIVMDEEHEPSYKSESSPRYHAREVAMKLAKLQNVPFVMGSATPSLEAYNEAKHGNIRLFTLTERATKGELPKVYVEDLRKELKEGNRSIFSRRLQELMKSRLENKQQILLFLNRRGYAGFLSCRACGHVMKCPHCEVSLSEHRNGKLICHYCGYEEKKVSLCPKCGSKYLLAFRAGTEQIEEKIKEMYPEARVLRMDADTTKKKDDYERILSAFSNREADILIGTQMIVKGHDFPGVTLVGILAADLSLAANDYRAAERTFSLLTQAAGRAGRGTDSGEVVIQTYQPEHYSVIHASNQDYESFFEEELLYRDLAFYPPVCHILCGMILGKNEAQVKKFVEDMAEYAKGKMADKKLQIIGPAPAGISKINDYYRYGIYIKSKEEPVLIKMKEYMEEFEQNTGKKDIMVSFDFDPIHPF